MTKCNKILGKLKTSAKKPQWNSKEEGTWKNIGNNTYEKQAPDFVLRIQHDTSDDTYHGGIYIRSSNLYLHEHKATAEEVLNTLYNQVQDKLPKHIFEKPITLSANSTHDISFSVWKDEYKNYDNAISEALQFIYQIADQESVLVDEEDTVCNDGSEDDGRELTIVRVVYKPSNDVTKDMIDNAIEEFCKAIEQDFNAFDIHYDTSFTTENSSEYNAQIERLGEYAIKQFLIDTKNENESFKDVVLDYGNFEDGEQFQNNYLDDIIEALHKVLVSQDFIDEDQDYDEYENGIKILDYILEKAEGYFHDVELSSKAHKIYKDDDPRLSNGFVIINQDGKVFSYNSKGATVFLDTSDDEDMGKSKAVIFENEQQARKQLSAFKEDDGFEIIPVSQAFTQVENGDNMPENSMALLWDTVAKLGYTDLRDIKNAIQKGTYKNLKEVFDEVEMVYTPEELNYAIEVLETV